jgi:hypothetical protein
VSAENSKKRKLKTMSFGFAPKKTVAQAFKAADSDDEETEGAPDAGTGGSILGAAGSDVKPETGLSAARKEEIDKTAQWLTNNPENESIIFAKSKGNPKFAFLFDSASEEGRYFAEIRGELKLQAEVKAVCGGSGDTVNPPVPQVVIQQNAMVLGAPQHMAAGLAAAQAMAQALAKGQAAVAPFASSDVAATPALAVTDGGRRNRWGPPVLAAPQPNNAAPSSRQKKPPPPGVAGSYGPVDHVAALPETLDEMALKQLRDQKQMQLLQQRALDGARAQAQEASSANMSTDMRLHEERLKAYENLAAEKEVMEEADKDTIEDAEFTGGVIEGGTWEHRKRAKEMLATADVALGLTLGAKGKSGHVADFLPKEELDSFLNAKVCPQLLLALIPIL